MRLFWLRHGAAFLFWSIVGLFYSLQVFLLQRPQVTWGEAMLRIMSLWCLWGLSTPCLAWLNRKLPYQQPLAKLIVTRALLGGFWTIGHVSVYSALIQALPLPVQYQGFAAYIQFFPWNYLICLVILAGHIAWNYYEQARRRKLDAVTLGKQLIEARLRSLQAQLHLHFLFNTLNAISAYAES